MKIHHVKSRLKYLNEELLETRPEEDLSKDAIGELVQVAAAFRTEAEVQFKENSKLDLNDDWILDTLYHLGNEKVFLEVFKCFCKLAAGDTAKLYEYSCLFFYRAYSDGDPERDFVSEYRLSLENTVAPEDLDYLLTKLQKCNVIKHE